MAENSNIGWTTHTANLWWGCVEVSPLCDNCYAREFAKRYDRAKWGADEPRVSIKSVWNDLKKFQRNAADAGRIDRVFVGSMMDIFEKPMPVVDSKGEEMGIDTGALRRGFFEEVVPASPNLLFLLLTKRPANIPKYIPDSWRAGAPSNVMFGTSIGTIKTIDAAWALREAPGRRFLSIEPLLEPLGDLPLDGIEWVITGIESRGARAGRFADGYENAAWRIAKQCRHESVKYFNKQMPINGKVSHDPNEWPLDLRSQEVPT